MNRSGNHADTLKELLDRRYDDTKLAKKSVKNLLPTSGLSAYGKVCFHFMISSYFVCL